MIEIRNDCCGCATESYPCMGSLCPMRSTKHYICDCCGDDVGEGELYQFDGEQLCIDCIRERLEVVE